MIDDVKKQVLKLLENDNSGYGIEHVERVLKMSLKFAEEENANKEIVSLIALLHDVDDYKLFGIENASNLTNAKNILEKCSIKDDIKLQILDAIKTIGYSKRLRGISPITLEAMVVSDADMCDGIGVTGILRSYQYNLSHGNSFFDKNVYHALNMSSDEYIAKKSGTVVTHMFEKQLKLKDLMLTDSGKNEAIERHNIMVQILYHFFKEEDNKELIDYLENYINNAK